MKKISIVIPVFNQEKYIEQCLSSIQSQAFGNLEIIVVDDGSTDSTLAILRRLRDGDERIIILEQSNKGAGAARNFGMTFATGDFVHFVDSDDWLEPDAYSKLIGIQSSNPSDIIVFFYNRFDNNTGEFRKVQLFPLAPSTTKNLHTISDKQTLLNTSVVPWNKLYRKEFLDRTKARFDETKVANDRTFYFKSVLDAESICLFAEALINYRVNNESSLIGSSRATHIQDLVAAYTSTFDTCKGLDSESREKIIKATINDLFGVYEKAKLDQKLRMAPIISSFLKSEAAEHNPALAKKEGWDAKLAIFKSFSREDSRKVIPVVMATNDNYAPYLFATVNSISRTLNEGYRCRIFVFHSSLSRKYVDLLENSLEYDNVDVFCIDVSAIAEAQETYSRAHYSIEMYYRILIPELLDMYEKILYLDCDLIVTRSVSELYEIDLGDNYIAGVRNFCNQSMFNWIKNSLKLDPANYVNTGVLLFNNVEFQKSEAKKKCFELLKSRDFLACPDQDMLNYACQNKIKIIDSGWNLQWHHVFKKYKSSDTLDFSRDDLTNAETKRFIIHYTSGIKAWSHPLYEYADAFWKNARETLVYSEVIQANLKKKMSQIMDRISELRKE
jgi:lipopolysaccharide biosynthesis glycosyltransferase/glycosyltransferase involved in cell wall biosynthesis